MRSERKAYLVKFVVKVLNYLREVFDNPMLLFLDHHTMLVIRPLRTIENKYDCDWITKKMGQAEEKCAKLWIFTSLSVEALNIKYGLAFYNPYTVLLISTMCKMSNAVLPCINSYNQGLSISRIP